MLSGPPFGDERFEYPFGVEVEQACDLDPAERFGAFEDTRDVLDAGSIEYAHRVGFLVVGFGHGGVWL